ncbi:MAG: sigma-54 dependent transcriptional regulator [Bacteroidales bacterium]|nr:sigma-54 dependent transcriptional regulator [Bacteroidales bacterium]
MSFKIYILEDDVWYGQVLLHYLSSNSDYEVSLFQTARELLRNLYHAPDLICMDFGLPDMPGDRVLAEIKSRNKQIPVIVISAQEEIAVAVNLLKAGAYDYIIKDEYAKDMLWKSILQVRETLSLRNEVEELKEKLESKYTFEKTIIGQSEGMQRAFRLLQKAIQSTINVSLYGETGTGKEVFAKAIHFNSERRRNPFIALNMAAIPHELIESELFGYEKGAFTGANGQKKGKFEDAEGGTLFLDEIAELDLSLQTKLLRVIQEREVVRLGNNKPIPVNIRLITATHKNLSEEVNRGRFREDLFFRIVGLPIEIPPLRERQNDVLILAKHFLDEYATANQCQSPALSALAKSKLKSYNYPGNVRELKAIIDLACVMSDGKEIQEEDITFYQLGDKQIIASEDKTLKEYEIDIITAFLKKYNSNVVLVADKLGVGKSKIYNLIKGGDINLKA